MDPEARKMWRTAGRYSALGIEMVLSVVFGVLAGQWLDKKLGTAPYLFYVGIGVGIGAAAAGLIRAARQYTKESNQ